MSKASKTSRHPSERLRAIMARLEPVLTPHGFQARVNQQGVSSGGAFANGFFERPPLTIGLIVRGTQLGLPTYRHGRYHCGHQGLIEKLNRLDASTLRWDDDLWALVTTDGKDVVGALVADIEHIILPALLHDPLAYRQAVNAAHKARLARW